MVPPGNVGISHESRWLLAELSDPLQFSLAPGLAPTIHLNVHLHC